MGIEKKYRVSYDCVSSMSKLFFLLNDKGITCRWIRKPGWNQILIERGNRKISAVSHFGSYGAEEGLIEVWDFNKPPRGWLTAAEAFEIIQIWEARNEIKD